MSLLTLAVSGALAVAPALDSLDLAAGQVQSLQLPDTVGEELALDIVLDGEKERLRLLPHSMRGPGFQVLVPGPDGSLQPTQVAAATTVRGTVAGRPGAWVAGSLAEGRLDALVFLGDGRSFGIQPVSGAASAPGELSHIVYEASDIVAPAGVCATPDATATQRHFGGGAPQALGVLADYKVCEIACDADFEFYVSNNSSVDKTIADIEKILIGVEAIYGIETEILYEIGTIIVRTDEPDPYSLTDPSSLLSQFDSHWSSEQSGVQRDIAHLFTGKNLDGSVIGIARLNAICSQTNGFGLSQSKYTSNLVLRTRLTAHELGHNWSSPHCNGEGDCGIMCQGGCGSPTEFGTSSTAFILQEKASSGCLGPLTGAPLVTAVAGSVNTWMPTPVELEGENLFTATAVTVDGVAAESFTVIDELSIEFLPALPASLGDLPVTVTTLLGTSNEVLVSFTDTDPPELDAPVNPGYGQVETWRYAGKANAGALLVFGFANTTLPIAGIDLLLPDTILSVGSLSPIGLGEFTFTFPNLPIFTFVYSQLVTVEGATVKATEVKQSIVFI